MTTDFGSLQPHLSARLIADLNAGVPLLTANNANVIDSSSSPNNSSSLNASTLPPKRDLLLNSLVNNASSGVATSNEFDTLLQQRRCAPTDEYGNSILHLPPQPPPQLSADLSGGSGGILSGGVDGLVTEAYDLVHGGGHGVGIGLGGISLTTSTASTVPPPLKIRTLDTGKATLDHFNIEPL